MTAQFKSKSRLEAENAALRHQLIVLRRKVPGRVRLTNHDRWFLIQLYRWFPAILHVVNIVQPETLVRWHRTGFRWYWRWKSCRRGGRPQIETGLTVTKFHSDSERKLAVILERESLKWLRPAKGQFQMFYRSGNDHLEYQPDFVAEIEDRILMLEPKMATQMQDKDVRAKRDVAIQWCAWASEHARSYNGKHWQYLLIPHDAIAENMTLEFLSKQYSH